MQTFRQFARTFVCGWAPLATFPVAAWAGGDSLSSESGTQLVERDLSGPRIGVTCRLGGPETSHGVGRFVSQFGWHSETQFAPRAGGPQFVGEIVPLVAGVEYGKFLPSVTLGVGVRLPSGYEFGIGPTISLGGEAANLGFGSSLFVTVGRSFDYGGVRLPVNLVYNGNQDWNGLTLLVGYAIQRASREVGAEASPAPR